ncbi:MAG: ABC transporter permease [Reichenbachiella sp.]|uniref:ABC transporter permease n=1 Tax=Reichenbachiella sp. TaxID=2184521 RepID=UPI0032679CAA
MSRNAPPAWIDRLLEWYCSDRYLEEVQGDLHEWYDHNSAHGNRRVVNLRYFIAVLQYFSLFRTKSFQKLINNSNFLSMKSVLLLTIRNFKKNKFTGSVRMINLVIGIGIFLIALIYAKYELAYDSHHERADNIYRVGYAFESKPWAATPVGAGIYALENIPEVKNMTRFLRIWDTSFKFGERQFYEAGGFMVDSTVFSMFSYPMLQGDPKTALKEKMSIVLTESLARKYFGEENPMGKIIALSLDYDNESGEQGTRIVTGVIEDIPEQSHLKFDFLCPAHTMKDSRLREWRNFWVYTYVEVENQDAVELTKAALKSKFVSLRNMDQEEMDKMTAVLTPLKKIHLYSNHEKEYADNGNIFYVYILFSIGLFVLIVSSINFINLSIIHGLDRAKEIGLRKTIGASRFQLIVQFMSENLFLLIIASVLCVFVLTGLEPWILHFSGLDLPLSMITNPGNLLYLGILIFLLQVVSGIYPALVLSRFRPAEIIKSGGQSIPMKRIGLTRKALIVMQFAISLVLVIGSIIVYRQLDYIQSKDLGFEKDQVLLVPLNSSVSKSFEALENELLTMPGIRSISTSSSVPGYRIMMQGLMELGAEEESNTRLLFADDTFNETYDIELLAGRSFQTSLPEGVREFMLNETATKKVFGTRDPIGKTIIASRDTGRVVGIVKDFNFKSLHSEIDPLTIASYHGTRFGYASIKFEPRYTEEVLAAVEETGNKVYPNLPPLSYEFLDDRFEVLYLAESKLKGLVLGFCIITILLTVSGILGIATYSAKKRAKEIAIRKVLGGTLTEMIGILSRSFIYLLLISLLIGLPGAFFLSDWWLQDFAYRIAITPITFVLSTLIMGALILLSFGFMTFKTVRTNPAEVLKSE